MIPDLWHAFLGGLLIGAGATTLLLLNGKIAGISGIFDNAVRGLVGPKAWRLAFLIGLVLPALIFGLGRVEFSKNLLLLAGVLFGSGLLLSRMCDPQRALGFRGDRKSTRL